MSNYTALAQAIARNIERFGHYQGDGEHYNDGPAIRHRRKDGVQMVMTVLPSERPCCILANPAMNKARIDESLAFVANFERVLTDEAHRRHPDLRWSATSLNDELPTDEVLDILRSI